LLSGHKEGKKTIKKGFPGMSRAWTNQGKAGLILDKKQVRGKEEMSWTEKKQNPLQKQKGDQELAVGG